MKMSAFLSVVMLAAPVVAQPVIVDKDVTI